MNLLFDLDGTISDSKEGVVQSIRHALREVGLPEPEAEFDWNSCLGPPIQHTFARLAPGADADALLRFREKYTEEGMTQHRPYEGILAAIRELKARGARLFVATAKAERFARPIIEGYGLTGCFEGIYGSQLDGTRANKVELLRYLLERERLAPATTVMIGDREHDLHAAAGNGIQGLGVAWGYGSIEELRTAGAREIFTHPDELVLYFEKKVSRP